jgi:hypothetical protein
MLFRVLTALSEELRPGPGRHAKEHIQVSSSPDNGCSDCLSTITLCEATVLDDVRDNNVFMKAGVGGSEGFSLSFLCM